MLKPLPQLLMDVLLTKFKRGDDILAKKLLVEGVEYIFGYPGGAIMPIYDALHRYSDRIDHVLTRHEQGAIFASQGYTRTSKKVGICMSTSGPGATNFITGLADSFIDSAPILCICGQVSSLLLGKNSFQETNIIEMSYSITKWNAQVLTSQDIGIIFQKAFYLANSERSSPVVIEITKDAQIKKSSFDDAQYQVELSKIDRFCPFTRDFSKIEETYDLINSSKKPLVLVGHGVYFAKASEELKNFIEKADLPICSTLLGVDIIEHINPLFVGMIGMYGTFTNNLLTNQCDMIIGVGMRFDDRVTVYLKRYARQAKILHIEVDPCEISKHICSHISVVESCQKSLPIITENLRKTTKKVWIDIFYYLKKCEEKTIIREVYIKNNTVSMGEIIKYFNAYKDKDAALVSDVGQHQMISSRYFSFYYSKSKVTSGGSGTMGFSFPAAFGAQFGSKDRQIICLVGDGGLQMTIQEFGTVLQAKLPIKIILFNNNFLGMVRQWQELFFERRYTFTKLINPDFIEVAKSFDIESKKVLERLFLDKGVKEMLQFTRAYFLDVVVKKEENVFPMIMNGGNIDEIRLN